MREDLGLKQRELAGILGLNRASWANIEGRRRAANHEVLKVLYPYALLLQDQQEPEVDALVTDKATMETALGTLRYREKIKLTARLHRSQRELSVLTARCDRALIVLNRLIQRMNDPSYSGIPRGLMEVSIYRLREIIGRTSPSVRAKVEVRIAGIEGALAYLRVVELGQNADVPL